MALIGTLGWVMLFLAAATALLVVSSELLRARGLRSALPVRTKLALERCTGVALALAIALLVTRGIPLWL